METPARILVRRNGLSGGVLFDVSTWTQLLNKIAAHYDIPRQRLVLHDQNGKWIIPSTVSLQSLRHVKDEHLVAFNGANEPRIGTVCESCRKPRYRYLKCAVCLYYPFEKYGSEEPLAKF